MPLFQTGLPYTVTGADPTGVVDATAAFVSAIDSLPTVTLYATPSNSTGASATYHYGTIYVPPGKYKIGSSSDIGNIGPLVSIIGAGSNCTQLNYYGSGDCIRIQNAVRPSSDTFDTIAAWNGKIDGFVVDLTNAGAGANGIHKGDVEGGILGPDLHVRHANGTGSNGLYYENAVSWTEDQWGRVTFYDCTNCVVFNVTTGDLSFEYNDLIFKCYCFANQNAVVFENGANYTHGSLRVLANFARSNSALTNSLLTVTGSNSGNYSLISYCNLNLQAELDLSGTHTPRTIKFGDAANNGIFNCTGVMSFTGGWTASNWSVTNSFAAGTFTFNGQISGDSNLIPAGAGGLSLMGAILYSSSEVFDNGQELAQGDFFNYQLDASITITFQQNAAAPQRKTFFFQQAASGGPYTITWPKPGSPTLNSPAFYWAAGVAPTMTATASAIDMYQLETFDGIHWYGRAVQNLS